MLYEFQRVVDVSVDSVKLGKSATKCLHKIEMVDSCTLIIQTFLNYYAKEVLA